MDSETDQPVRNRVPLLDEKRVQGAPAYIGIGLIVLVVLAGAVAVVLNGRSQPAGPITTTASPTPPVPYLAGAVPFEFDGRHQPDLDNAVVDLPDFHQPGCPSGRTPFRDGEWFSTHGPSTMAAIVDVAVADVTFDGRLDHVVSLECHTGTDIATYAVELVAFTEAADRSWTSTGVVTQDSNGHTMLTGLGVTPLGTITVIAQSLSGNHITSQQRRVYRYDAGSFRPDSTGAQVPVTRSSTQLAITPLTPDVALTGSGHLRQGQLSLTIANRGSARIDHLSVKIDAALPLTLSPPAATGTLTRSDFGSLGHEWLFTVGPIPPGAIMTLTLPVSLDLTTVTGAAPASSGMEIVLDTPDPVDLYNSDGVRSLGIPVVLAVSLPPSS